MIHNDLSEEARVSRRAFLVGGGTLLGAALVGRTGVEAGASAPKATAPAVITTRKNLVVGLFTDPPTLNYFLRTDTPGGMVAQNIYNKLVRANTKTRAADPELATEWKQTDPTTWVVKLRQGVKWHGGYGDFTADDVVFTYQYTIDNKTFQYSNAIFIVNTCKALDKYTVEFKLKQPFGAFPLVTMEYGGTIMCRKAHQEMGEQKYGRTPIGTGPFRVESWRAGAEIVLKKNPDYWKRGQPYLDELVYRIIPDATVRFASLRKGEIDFMTNPDAKDIPALRAGKEPSIVYSSIPGWNWDYISFTFPEFNKKPNFPTVKKEVRQAISYAIDRQAIVDTIYMGDAIVTDSPIPPGFLAYRPGPLKYPARGDLTKAKQLMQQAGVSNFDIECITSDKMWLRQETELVASMLSQIGINVKIVGQDMGTFNARWTRRQFEMLLEDIATTSPDTDATVWTFYHKNGRSYAGAPNAEEVTKWVDDARASSNPKQRETLYHKIVDHSLDIADRLYLVHVKQNRLYRRGLTGYEPSPMDYLVLFDTVKWEG